MTPLKRIAIDPKTITPQSLGKVGVLMGGTSAEREVSLMSGQGVLDALRAAGVNAQAFDPAVQTLAQLEQADFDRVFIALHGRFGEDGCIQGALEVLGIPYTGSDVLASSMAMNKVLTKQIWQQQGLSTPAYCTVNAASDWSAVAAQLGLPLIIKPAHEGSTIGLTKVTAIEQLPAAYELAARNDSLVLAEQFIEGPELTCAVLGQGAEAFALPVIRINAPQGNYDYQHKYFSDDTEYLCPSGLSPAAEQTVQALVLASYHSLNCRGWARSDVMQCSRSGQYYLLEINTSPGMTGHSLVPMSAKVFGWSYIELCLYLLAQAQCVAPRSNRS